MKKEKYAFAKLSIYKQKNKLPKQILFCRKFKFNEYVFRLFCKSIFITNYIVSKTKCISGCIRCRNSYKTENIAEI